jgi:hypothetical protein
MAGDALGFGVSFFILWTEEGIRKKKNAKKRVDVERLLGRPKILV